MLFTIAGRDNPVRDAMKTVETKDLPLLNHNLLTFAVQNKAYGRYCN
jgi:hypothetical protein